MSERLRRESVWCCRYEFCGGIGVSGWEGGGRAMLCEKCQAKDDAARGVPARDEPVPAGTPQTPDEGLLCQK